MLALLSRLFIAAVLLVAMAEASAACGGEQEPGESGNADVSDEVGASEDPATSEKTVTSDGAGSEAGVEKREKPGEPRCMLDVFRRLEVGDWVRTGWTNKEKHTLLVVAKTDEMITIEEIVEDRGFRKAWTQLDVALEDGMLLALRERLADGTIEEREPAVESQRGTSDLLLEPFRPDGREEIRIKRIEVFTAGKEEPEIRRGLFLCRRYRITVEEGRYAHLWFSRIKLPDYPVKIHYYEENLTIKLEAFGSGRESAFTKVPEPRRRNRTKAK